MRRPATWLMAVGSTVALAVLVWCVLVVIPLLLPPPLSPADLQEVAGAEKRIELQQAQARLETDAGASLLQSLLQSIGGVLLVIGVVATWRQVQVSREGQITERFSRAIDHLGSDKPDVRLGGIYTLERIAKDSPADRGTVATVLSAFIRSHAPWLVGAPDGPEHPSPTVDARLPWLQHRAPDVDVAMSVLGQRRDELQPYLSRVDLRSAYLLGAQLPNTAIRHSNLAGAVLAGANLEGSDLEDTDLRQAWLRQARLTGANLRGAYLQNAELREADLQDADLRGANLRSADLRGVNLQGARLEGADLTNAKIDATTKSLIRSKPN
jgi:hypothetical protein